MSTIKELREEKKKKLDEENINRIKGKKESGKIERVELSDKSVTELKTIVRSKNKPKSVRIAAARKLKKKTGKEELA